MRNLRKMAALLMAAALIFSMSMTALAAVDDTGFSDVDANAWYAEAATYCRDNGLMSGTSTTTFSPNATMTRAMLAVVLYRLSGSPAVTGSDAFTDTRTALGILKQSSGPLSRGWSAAMATDFLEPMILFPASRLPQSFGDMMEALKRKAEQTLPTKAPSPLMLRLPWTGPARTVL